MMINAIDAFGTAGSAILLQIECPVQSAITKNKLADHNQKKRGDWCSLRTVTQGRLLEGIYRTSLAGDAFREVLNATLPVRMTLYVQDVRSRTYDAARI